MNITRILTTFFSAHRQIHTYTKHPQNNTKPAYSTIETGLLPSAPQPPPFLRLLLIGPFINTSLLPLNFHTAHFPTETYRNPSSSTKKHQERKAYYKTLADIRERERIDRHIKQVMPAEKSHSHTQREVKKENEFDNMRNEVMRNSNKHKRKTMKQESRSSSPYLSFSPSHPTISPPTQFLPPK